MPVVYKDIIQGSSQWLSLRAGIPTASQFHRIITPGGKPSKSAEMYLYELLAERMTGLPTVEAVSYWMSRGSQIEDEAVSFYELQRDCETVKVGFITNDEGTIGASPDRLVGDDGLLEIKVPKESTHVSYLLKKAVDQAYYPQVQGQLWVSGRKWADILSYHPEMPPALIRVERDEEFISALSAAVSGFSRLLEGAAADLATRGWIVSAEKDADEGYLTTQDIPTTQPLCAPAPTTPILATPLPAPPQAETKAKKKPKSPEEIASNISLFLKAASLWKSRLLDMDDTEDANRRYYAVLESLGVKHANELMSGVEPRRKALRGWSDAMPKTPVTANHTTFDQMREKAQLIPAIRDGQAHDAAVQSGSPSAADGGEAPASSQLPLAPEKASGTPAQREAPATDPPSGGPPTLEAAKDENESYRGMQRNNEPLPDEWTRDMTKLLAANALDFWDKLAGWGFPSIEAIPFSQRAGRLEAMKLHLRVK